MWLKTQSRCNCPGTEYRVKRSPRIKPKRKTNIYKMVEEEEVAKQMEQRDRNKQRSVFKEL